jgi:hypothetical protein
MSSGFVSPWLEKKQPKDPREEKIHDCAICRYLWRIYVALQGDRTHGYTTGGFVVCDPILKEKTE